MTRPVGVEAKFESFCKRCGQDIHRGDRVVRVRDRYIHAACAAGQDEQ